jgi:hypothetical protein
MAPALSGASALAEGLAGGIAVSGVARWRPAAVNPPTSLRDLPRTFSLANMVCLALSIDAYCQ